MNLEVIYSDFVPLIVPQKNIGKLTHKICIKKDYKRGDGNNALYLQIYQDGIRRRLPLNLAVPLKYFDVKKQRVKRGFRFYESFNLIIEKKLADLNRIEINYRLANKRPTLKSVIEDLNSPSLRINYNVFAENILESSKDNIRESTYRQQKGALQKIKRFKDPILFSDIDEDFINELRHYCKAKLKNKPATVESTMKNFKKYLHVANKKGIATKATYADVKVKKMTGERIFLLPEELKKVYDYYNSPFISGSRKYILQRYLFSCFTGIRISDIEQLTEENFIGDHLAFTMVKTEKFIRIKLNKTALSLINLPTVFIGEFTREHINRELKVIANSLGINKRLYFHSSRHTFATNFLISGGDIVNLRKLLGHSEIKETMIYVHIVQSITDSQVDLLDAIVK